MATTLLLRLPTPGSEDTEWLVIDEAGVPATARHIAAQGGGIRARPLSRPAINDRVTLILLVGQTKGGVAGNCHQAIR